MITEDYVSFEVAKLLKEKEFNWDCITYYKNSEPDVVKHSMIFENNTTWYENWCSAPTLQMACKWLREVHKIYIDVIIEGVNSCIEYKAYARPFKIIYPVRNYDSIDTIKIGRYNSYEKAVEEALKYTLENLI